MFYSQPGLRPRTWEASSPEHKKWVEVFKACDEDNKGYLSREDFKVAVVMLFGYKPSKIEADSVMSSVDPNTSGIRLKEFLDIVRKKKEAQLYRSEVRHIFTAFDRHYRGYLTLEDFKKAFKQVAPKLSERIILEVFREVDQDSDGHVSFKDFEYAMNSGQKFWPRGAWDLSSLTRMEPAPPALATLNRWTAREALVAGKKLVI
ncbi:EF-hand calcium-binding domain-containing protein 11 isoform X4 [Moschus berezovskii]|uniref:EF-hand calcium-binding domain-containing protein 11 isoform X4 n=1 Tax=Moschus berezovskii TaxID=68408 RepID=UPI00244397A8|nr:EF-hand calcium-binding domain-containing protein 11 isoform X4 [Moschus berezovskii]